MRERDPQPGVVASDRLDQRGCDPEAHQRADERLERGRARPERVGAQHRQRRQHDPEGVLDRGGLRHQHREREPEAGTRRVAEAHRMHVAVRAQDRPCARDRLAGPRRACARCRVRPRRRRRRSGPRRARAGATGTSPRTRRRRAPRRRTAAPTRPNVRARRCARRAPAVSASTPFPSCGRPGDDVRALAASESATRAASAVYSGVGSATGDRSARGHAARATGPGGGWR